MPASSQTPWSAEQIPRPYSRAEENAHELTGDFGMTEHSDYRTQRRGAVAKILAGRWGEMFIGEQSIQMEHEFLRKRFRENSSIDRFSSLGIFRLRSVAGLRTPRYAEEDQG